MLTLDDIRKHLRTLDEPVAGRRALLQAAGVDPGPAIGGRVDVFDSACGAAGRALAYLAIEARDEGKALAAINVLLTVAEDVLRHVTEETGLPISHVVPELERVRELVINVGRIG